MIGRFQLSRGSSAGSSRLTSFHRLPARARRRLELTRTDRIAGGILTVAGIAPVAGLAFLAYEMFKSAYPAIVFNGWGFFTGKVFSLGNLYGGADEVRHGYHAASGAHYGILPLIFGTLVCSLIALAIALPVSVGGAILLVEKIPQRFQYSLGVFLDLLAGIPSVIFGLWGLYTLGPLLARNVYPLLADLHIPWIKRPVGSGQGLLTASVVLAVMVIPIIASITRELVRSVPTTAKEGAIGLGLTSSEMVRVVTLPYIRTGVIAATILGWGRALGETIAVLIISGNFLNAYPHSLFAPFSTMAATIASFLDGALTDSTKMGIHSLAELGLVLLAITLITNFGGRLLTRRFADTGLPVGRGV